MAELYSCPPGKPVRLVATRGPWKATMRRNAKICRWCGAAIQADATPPRRATIDHILPTVRGGPNVPRNVKVSCNRCNSGRAAVDHCYVTFVCLDAIHGPSLSAIARAYNQSRKAAEA